MSGDLTVGTVASGDAPNLTNDDDWYDVDVDLTGLADHTLDANGTVTFRLSFTGGTLGALNHHQVLDNVAISELVTGILGDFDNDGDVDLVDLDRYNGTINAEAIGDLEPLDLNSDGTIGADDFAQHYETLVETSNSQKGTFAGDLNLDGTVDVLSDAFALVSNLGNDSATSWAQGDIDANGIVDVLGDAFALVGNLGNSNNR